MKFALAQIDPTVGDIDGNTKLILSAFEEACEAGADVVIFPELCVFGYPPKDAVYRTDLVKRNVEAVERIARACAGKTVIVGYVQPDASGEGRGVFNAAAVCRDGAVQASYAKTLLPTYDVFDEARYFNPGTSPLTVEVKHGAESIRVGVTICEDLWNDAQFEGRRVYGQDPVRHSIDAGAELIVNISASPFRAGMWQGREQLFSSQMKVHQTPLFYVNQFGGNDDVLFDGASLAMDARGAVIARAKAFEKDLLLVDWPVQAGGRVEAYPEDIASIRAALVMGIRDYAGKCGFHSALVGVSGGVDSAVTAALAVEALGKVNVHAVAMPSRYSSDHSLEDAEALARLLDIRYTVISIEQPHRAMEAAIAGLFAEAPANASTVAEENIQARIRGSLLMSVSNKFNSLLLTTGNKSEWAVGYCTLYGDMCGGLAVLNDVPKTSVFALARHINEDAGRVLIPERTITKPPSAELRANQYDQDTLPPYDVLDALLEHYVTQGVSAADIVKKGFDRQLVDRVVGMVDRSEYKRKQSPVGLKVTSRAFGSGWRMPIAAKLR